ncbi:MAG TPA: response regulator [Myxococcota bacterium]|nr:response regulator [Myxococcota bacterium]
MTESPAEHDTLLLVEDDDAVRYELRELLEDEGYDVVEAADGGAALEALDAGLEPKVVVLDLMMPGMDGWEFLGRLKRHAKGKTLPVVVATAVDERRLLPKGVPCVRKPLVVESLLQWVHSYTDA